MRGWKGAVTAVVLAALVAGCASQATPTPGASHATAQGSAPALPNPDAAVSTGPLDPSIVAALKQIPVAQGDALGPALADAGAQLRARDNAQALFGTTAADLESGLDKAESDALQQLEDKAKAQLKPAGDASVRLASARQPAPGAATQDTALLGLAWVFVITIGGTAISLFDPKAGDIAPTTITQNADFSGASGDIQANVTLTFSSAGGVVTGTINVDGGRQPLGGRRWPAGDHQGLDDLHVLHQPVSRSGRPRERHGGDRGRREHHRWGQDGRLPDQGHHRLRDVGRRSGRDQRARHADPVGRDDHHDRRQGHERVRPRHRGHVVVWVRRRRQRLRRRRIHDACPARRAS